MKTMATLLAAGLLALAVCLTPQAHAAGCQATSCKVVPCSTSLSATDGYQHTPDDAMAAGRDLPEGCDPAASKVP